MDPHASLPTVGSVNITFQSEALDFRFFKKLLSSFKVTLGQKISLISSQGQNCLTLVLDFPRKYLSTCLYFLYLL